MRVAEPRIRDPQPHLEDCSIYRALKPIILDGVNWWTATLTWGMRGAKPMKQTSC